MANGVASVKPITYQHSNENRSIAEGFELLNI